MFDNVADKADWAKLLDSVTHWPMRNSHNNKQANRRKTKINAKYI